MKKTFLILAAAVVLSSLAFANGGESEKALFDGYPDDLPPVPEERLRAMTEDYYASGSLVISAKFI